MSEENVELVRAWMEAWNRADREGVLAIFEEIIDPEIEWDTSRMAGLNPDLAGFYRGKEEVRGFWRSWLSAWRELRFDFDVKGTGDEVVLLVRNQRQWGRYSGVETRVPPYAWVYTFRNAKIVQARIYPDHAEALESVGLPV